MACPHRFAHYPEPIDRSQAEPSVENATKDNNPVMRGLSLAIGASLVSNFAFLQRNLWNNAKFGSIKHMPELDNSNPPRFYPCVVPLPEGDAAQAMLAFEPHISTPAPADLPSRYNSAADYHAAYKASSVTPLQVAEAVLRRNTRGQEPRSKYDNAWVDFHGQEERILRAARESTERYAKGEERGLLDGVPFGVKDDLGVEGFVSHYGMRYDERNPFFKPSKKTMWAVRAMEEAGAVMVGKLAMHELGTDTTGCNPAWGTPTNWHNTSYYPGGSSSGAGSALGAGIIPIAIGTDAGGSARIPPSFNGMYGLKPTHHRLGHMDHTMCVICPMTSTVADLTAAYRTMAQPDPSSTTQGVFRASQPPAPSAKKTIGVCRAWNDRAAPEVRKLCEAAIEHYEKNLGYEVVDISIPYLREAQLAHGATCVTEMASAHYARAPTAAAANAMLQAQTKVLVSVGSQTPAVDYLKFSELREVVMQHVASLFRAHPDMLVVSPTTPLAGWPKHPGDEAYGFSDANVSLENMLYVFLANVTGCPAVTVPVGYAEPVQGVGKVPVGLMAMGEWGAEEQLLGWAAEAERYLYGVVPGGRRRPRGWVDILNEANDDEDKASKSDES